MRGLVPGKYRLKSMNRMHLRHLHRGGNKQGQVSRETNQNDNDGTSYSRYCHPSQRLLLPFTRELKPPRTQTKQKQRTTHTNARPSADHAIPPRQDIESTCCRQVQAKIHQRPPKNLLLVRAADLTAIKRYRATPSPNCCPMLFKTPIISTALSN